MTRLRFSSAAKKHIRSASRDEVSSYFAGLTAAEKRAKWIRKGNRYRVNCIERYRHDLDPHKPGVIDDAQILEYVAASGPTHVIDGWSLLSRAMDAAFRGDNYGAIHFAYYAELRASMSLLASEGIGVFNSRHPIVQNGGTIENALKAQEWNENTRAFGGDRWIGTHKIVWPLLQFWSTLVRSSDLLDGLISPENMSVSIWLDAIGIPASSRAIAKHWLQTWGLDLSIVDDDHDLRNLASYRPFEFRYCDPLPPHEIVEFAEDLWRLFEPFDGRRFQTLEKYLLRRTLREFVPVPPTQLQLENMGLSPLLAAEWAHFLVQTNDPKIFSYADQPSAIDEPYCHLQMMSRAALLLNLATGAVRRQLGNAAYTAQTLEFWWKKQGERRGFWESANAPANPVELFDLWNDIKDSIDAAEQWRLGPGAAATSMRTWRRFQPTIIDDLGSLELAGIWGLIP